MTTTLRTPQRVQADSLGTALPQILRQIYTDANPEQLGRLTAALLSRFEADPSAELTLHGGDATDETVMTLTELPYPTDVAAVTLQKNMAISDGKIVWWASH